MGKGAVVSESLTTLALSQFHTLIRRHVFARSPLASSFCRASAWQRLTLTRFVSLTTSIFTAPRWASRLSCQSTCSAPVYLSTNLAVIRPLPTSARRKGGGGCTPSWQRRQGGAWRRGFPAARSSPATHLASAARLRRERRGRHLRKRLPASAHDARARGRALHATPALAVAGPPGASGAALFSAAHFSPPRVMLLGACSGQCCEQYRGTCHSLPAQCTAGLQQTPCCAAAAALAAVAAAAATAADRSE